MSGDNLTNTIGDLQGIEFFDDGNRRPRRLAPSEKPRAKFLFSQRPTCSWSAVDRRVQQRRSQPGALAPR